MLDEFRLPVCDLLGDAATTATLTELVSKPAFLLFQLWTMLLNVHQLTKIYSARTILASVHNIGTKTCDVTRVATNQILPSCIIFTIFMAQSAWSNVMCSRR